MRCDRACSIGFSLCAGRRPAPAGKTGRCAARRSLKATPQLLLLLLLDSPLFAQRHVAITIDDLPIAGPQTDLAAVISVNDRVLQALVSGKVPAIGFVNEGRVTADNRKVLQQWLEAGMLLGNHTFSHPRLYDTPLEKYQEDVIRGEAITRPLMRERGQKRFYFRHPFTSTGKTQQDKEAFEKFLAARGYTIAPFTVESSDFVFNALYLDAIKAGDAELAARLRADYLKYTEAMFEYFEGLSQKLFKREIPQILLIHVNELHAVCLRDLLAMLKGRGYSFVSLDQALRDKAYETPDLYVGGSGPSWLHRWTVSFGVPFTLRDEPDPPKYVLDLWRKRSTTAAVRSRYGEKKTRITADFADFADLVLDKFHRSRCFSM